MGQIFTLPIQKVAGSFPPVPSGAAVLVGCWLWAVGLVLWLSCCCCSCCCCRLMLLLPLLLLQLLLVLLLAVLLAMEFLFLALGLSDGAYGHDARNGVSSSV